MTVSDPARIKTELLVIEKYLETKSVGETATAVNLSSHAVRGILQKHRVTLADESERISAGLKRSREKKKTGLALLYPK